MTNGIIQGDAFSPLLFIMMIDPVIKIIKKNVEENAETLYYMEGLKASTDSIERAQTIHQTVKRYVMAVGIMINAKESAI